MYIYIYVKLIKDILSQVIYLIQKSVELGDSIAHC